MTHEQRFLISETQIPSWRYFRTNNYQDEHIRISEYKLACYSDMCEQATMQVRSIACMLFRFKR